MPRALAQAAAFALAATLAGQSAPASAAPPTTPAPAASPAEAVEAQPEPEVEPEQDSSSAPSTVFVPRVDGGYYGINLRAGTTIARVNNVEPSKPFLGGGFSLRVGDVVYSWLSIGLDIEAFFGRGSAGGGQSLASGQLLIDFGFMPVKRVPWTLRTAFGFGGGRVSQSDDETGGFGGAAFRAATRYDFFPRVEKYRPRTGGGLAIGPELGWTVNTPSMAGNPLAHTITLGFALTWYRGR